jgi:hypothetical protein
MRLWLVALAVAVSHVGAIALKGNNDEGDDDTKEDPDPASKSLAAFPSQVRMFTHTALEKHDATSCNDALFNLNTVL